MGFCNSSNDNQIKVLWSRFPPWTINPNSVKQKGILLSLMDFIGKYYIRN